VVNNQLFWPLGLHLSMDIVWASMNFWGLTMNPIFFFFFFFGFRNSQPKQRTHIGFNKKPKTKPKFAQPNKALDILHFTLGLLHGLLVIVHSNEYLDYASYAVWVMKEYRAVQSWTQLYDIFVGTHDKVITFTKSAEVLV
jgi:hypothetical protein